MIKKIFGITFFVLFSITAISQSKKTLEKQEEIKNLVWNDNDPYKNVMDIPENWKNESAVFLVKNIKYIYNRPGNSIEYTKIERDRIKLLDQAAISEYSELKYTEGNVFYREMSRVTNTFFLGVKVIKPNGEEIEIDVNQESVSNNEEKKIAIPALEKGDIIDYYFYTNTIVGENDLYQYKPVENTIGDAYPIVKFEFLLETEDDFFLNFNTYNGAPKLQQIVEPTKKDKKRVYSFEAENVERNDFPRWFFPLVELPSYKFQVLFARSGKYQKKAYAFIPEESNTLKTNVSKEEIFNLYEDKFRPYGDLGDVERFLKNKNFATNEEKVKEVFYYIRHAYYTNYVEAFVMDESNIMYPFELYGKNPIIFNKDEEFVRFFTAFLKDNKIDYEIIIGTQRYNGDIKDLLLESNISFILKVNAENPVYIEYFDAYATPNQISPLLENTKAYALKVVDRKHIEDIEIVNLPTSTYKENNSIEKTELTIAPDFSGISINRSYTYNGQTKIDEQKNMLMYYDYVYEDHAKYETEPILDRVRNKKDKEKYKKEYAALLKKLKDKQQEKIKERTAAEYALKIDNYSFKILKNGRFGKEDSFEYTEEFTIGNDLIKTAGKNYILDIGKLLVSQVDLSNKEKGRTNNIYMSYPRSFNYQIIVNIPDGFSVSGLENLISSVENETGGFISKASIDGNKLVIDIQKFYKKNYEPNANWQKMVAFLEAASQFTQSKILLKKE
ncbi:DUF3857 domain-containing protein [Aequorivita antarctica]|uniref:DUF3857 domain-containing protein n=1 Tax=Aequorivita antarctica TaxID=153266 RepID=A0A5C6Z4F9_9FLAO|nr:DUF3857 domain-containing protein [Aequorivita antarctica]TXD75045.1 DUF3857 domain-containing protein [Aequorivita antarctica]SRX72225.1 hypothetical protein AEQU3_00056 [Aequorivita antarctica]